MKRRVAPSLSSLLIAAVALLSAAPLRAACPCSLWSAVDAPANLSANDPNAVELGMKFTAMTDGSVTALRFYKSSANGGLQSRRYNCGGR